MYSTFGSSRLPVICVGSSSMRSCPLPARAPDLGGCPSVVACALASAGAPGLLREEAALGALGACDAAPLSAPALVECEAGGANGGDGAAVGAAVGEVSTPGSS